MAKLKRRTLVRKESEVARAGICLAQSDAASPLCEKFHKPYFTDIGAHGLPRDPFCRCNSSNGD
ncbi:MAG: hypothetical protein JHD23_06930 [Akkermansiaceae bacterium]|nr:hypothetical protein [Akkermansiaceae bacterium]